MSKTITIKDFSKKYEHCEPKVYLEVCKLFLWKLSQAIIREPYICQLPYALGTIYIAMRETSKRVMDFGTFNKTGVKTSYKNFHTFNKSFSYKWSKKNAIFKNKNIYYFKPIRDEIKREIGSRGLAQWIKDCARNNKDYKTVGML
jgi:hypothetical protein